MVLESFNMDEINCDMEVEPQPPILPDSSNQSVAIWNENFKKGILSCTHFKEHWRVWVPKSFSPEPNNSCLDWSFDEDKAQKILFDTLEEFICGGDPQVLLKNLRQLDNPPSVCGRVFKMGEPTYNCRECGMDATCVLCVDCFKKSVHRNHKYKMGTSSGGGCCDCGDTEAWRQDPYCDVHIVGIQKKDSTNELPKELAERARITFGCVLRYAYDLLTLEYSPGLPADLRLKEAVEDPLNFLCAPDTYCTVLYNDETHTFEQVINTLARVIKCSQRDAIEFVTNIDREGRAVVKCSTFQHCTELKIEIERYTSRHGNRPLKVSVVHAHVVAHQLYALRLLTWLQTILAYCEGFRILFSEVALQVKPPDTSIVEGILLRDSMLWKSARLHWHRLFISGMLMEYESKKAFARVFTKNYGSVMKDFIRDDHDHAFSVASLAVQIFTVPTLAHYLIAHEDVLLMLMNTFISECSRKLNKIYKLEFERNVPNGAFKRAQYILYDVRYLLGVTPDKWTDDLRTGFLQGVCLILNVLTYMQGMDAVARQVGQHMEYEPEWESAFNLHIKLGPLITLILKWCGTDRVVLIKAYRATLKKLYENPSFDPTVLGEVRELADHSAACLQYDVSSQPVSIHLPLSRFLAGLHLHLEKFGLNFDSSEFQILTKQTPEQIIEPVLRTQVKIAQVHAGMWRRNGYSLLNQLYFYHNVKCRSEMLDKDIVLLQVGASLIESNEFLIHLLNKFNLINWAHLQFEVNTLKNPEEDSIRQTTSLVEEFLTLLITIIGERYYPGVGKVTQDDAIKKEIIQQLCIRPLSHSELNKTLPDDVNHETGMEKVIHEIADFKKPVQATGKGVYELKPQFYDQYNVFFYHYTREELSKSEEEQRTRRKAAGELECCPPPALPPLSESFSMMANLLQCDVMLHIMTIVLVRSINLRARSFSEAQLHKVLHLIGYALHEEERQQCQFLLFTERAEKWKLDQLIEELCSCPRVKAHKDLLTWTLMKFRQVAAPKNRGEGQSTVADPLTESLNSQHEEEAKEERQWRSKMAAEKRAKVMAQMKAMQKSFMKENAKLFESTLSYPDKTGERRESNMDLSEVVDESPICLGPNQSTRVCLEKTYTCILCQEDQTVTVDGPALVLAAFVQKSTVLSQQRNITEETDDEQDPLFLSSNLGPAPHTSTCGHVMHSSCWQRYFDIVLAKENRRPYRLRQPASFDVEKNEFLCPLCECLNNTVLPLIPALGTLQQASQNVDVFKFDSWLQSIQIALNYKKKFQKVKASSAQSLSKPDSSVVTPAKELFINPIVAESTPVSAEPATDEEEADTSPDLSITDEELDYDDQPLQTTRPYNIAESDVVMQLLMYSRSEQCGDTSSQEGATSSSSVPAFPQLSQNLLEMILLFSQATYTRGLGVNPHQDDPRVPLLAWKSCAYTIHSLEWCTRYIKKPVLGHLTCRQQDCLEGLIRIAGVLGSTWKQEQVINGHALRLLSVLLDNPSDGPSLLDWDSFGILVPLTMSLPSLFYTEQPTPIPMGTSLELHSLHLIFISNIAQIILTCDVNRDGVPMDEGEIEESELQSLQEIVRILRPNLDVKISTLWKIIQDSSIPFLRCCVLFYHYLTGVPAPSVLTEVGGDTFVNLCCYLGLSTVCSELLSPVNVLQIIKKWANHDAVKKVIASGERASFRDIMTINKLVKLPDDYSELINTVSLFTCPNSDREDSRNPTMCLVCGEMLCSQSYCCQTELEKSLVSMKQIISYIVKLSFIFFTCNFFH